MQNEKKNEVSIFNFSAGFVGELDGHFHRVIQKGEMIDRLRGKLLRYEDKEFIAASNRALQSVSLAVDALRDFIKQATFKHFGVLELPLESTKYQGWPDTIKKRLAAISPECFG